MNRIDLEHLAEKIALSMRPGDNVFLIGDLGVGKSVFARAVLRTLGVTGNIPSPSFIVDAVYITENNEIHHIDLYRLDGDPRELQSFGVYDALDSSSLAVVEWADRLEEEILDNGILINIGFTVDSHLREVVVDDRRLARN
ncbi:MAG: tRNA (adenosine(37)-N6)-threonylcarbamoyltransferase complex ATPase subunit type 1 TsaE [Candidatus Aegiribacteria sp.]|nr:tRNA (adenosine(37)-N6)-threonylcarbamoyltransferase complex ATPase subunit type 1 TsaE [Candidatus Aegiribacteria sp.]